MPAEVFGFIGGAMTMLSLIPQLVRVFKLKSAREISGLFSILLLLGTISWLAMGISLRLFPVIFWNTIGVVLISTLLYAKVKFSR